MHGTNTIMGTGYFPGVKSGRGVTLTPHLLLVPRSRKSRAIPLLPLWAVRPVQSLSACTRVIFTLKSISGKPTGFTKNELKNEFLKLSRVKTKAGTKFV